VVDDGSCNGGGGARAAWVGRLVEEGCVRLLHMIERDLVNWSVTPDFKDKTRYAPYVSFGRQASHIATNKG